MNDEASNNYSMQIQMGNLPHNQEDRQDGFLHGAGRRWCIS
jgi:hypothetical protein